MAIDKDPRYCSCGFDIAENAYYQRIGSTLYIPHRPECEVVQAYRPYSLGDLARDTYQRNGGSGNPNVWELVARAVADVVALKGRQ